MNIQIFSNVNILREVLLFELGTMSLKLWIIFVAFFLLSTVLGKYCSISNWQSKIVSFAQVWGYIYGQFCFPIFDKR